MDPVLSATVIEIDLSKPEGVKQARTLLHKLTPAEVLRVLEDNQRESKSDNFTRGVLTAEVRMIDKAKRTIELSFSSEQPVERWFGTEILSHASGAADLEWLNSGNAPLLWMHDARQQIGIVCEATQVGKKCRAQVRLANDEEGTRYLNRIDDGIIKNVSFAYRIQEWTREETSGDDGDDDIYTATKWRGIEISFVSTPADETVGVGRSSFRCPDTKSIPTNVTLPTPPSMTPEQIEAARLESVRLANEAVALERKRINTLNALRRTYEARNIRVTDEEFDAITGNAAQGELELRRLFETKTATPARVEPSGVVVIRSEEDKDPLPLLHALRGLVFGDMPKHFTAADQALRAASPKCFQPAGNRESAIVTRSESLRSSRFPGLDSGVRAQNAQQLAAGGALVGVTFAPEIIPYLRPAPVLEQAGARIMSGITGGPGNIRFPKQAGDIYANWAAAQVASSAGQLPLGVLDLSPKRLVAQVQIDRQLLLQESFDIEAYVRNSINLQFALAYDLAGLIGNGNGMPLGILNTKNVQAGAVTFHGTNSSPRYSDFVSFRTKVLKANAGGLGERCFISSPDSVQNWATVPLAPDGATTITNGLFVLDQDSKVRRERCLETTYLNTLPTAYQNAGYTLPVADVVLYGPFGQYIFIEWAGVEWIYDPYTQAASDLIVLTARLYVDGGCLQPTAFVTSSNPGSVVYAP